MDATFEYVTRIPEVRCRPEAGGDFLLYNPATDQLHLIDSIGKELFDACDGRTISEVVETGSELLAKDSSANPTEVLAFLCSLEERSLVRFS